MKAHVFMSRLLGVVLLAALFWALVSLGGGLGSIADLPALLIIAAAAGGGLVASFGLVGAFGPFVRAAGRILGAKTTASRRDAAVFDRARQLVWAGGAVGTVLGAIIIFSSVKSFGGLDPRSFAVALISLLYAAVIAELVIMPLKSIMSGASDASARPAVDDFADVTD